MKRPAASGSRHPIRLERLFLWFALPLYAAYALLTPPFQTPDEHQHLFRAWQLASFDLIGERRGESSGGMLPPGLPRAAAAELRDISPHADRTVRPQPVADRLARSTPVDSDAPTQFVNFFGSVLYPPAGYVPQIVAIWIGEALALSVEHILRLGRLLNGALAIGLLYAAIRLIPIGRLALFFVALMPMTAASAASLGQDGLIIGGVGLLTALGLRAMLDGRWRTRELASAAVLTAVVTLAKMTYLPMAAIAALPVPGGKSAWRWLLPPVLVMVASAALLLLWLATVTPLVVSMRADVPAAGARIAAILQNPAEFAPILWTTFVSRLGLLVGTLFRFGWLTVGPVIGALVATYAALGIVLITGDSYAHRLTRGARLWLIVVAVSVVILIALAMYLTFTPAGSPHVEGLQARYFLPIAPALLIGASRVRKSRTRWPEVSVILLMAAANLAALHAIARAFYL